MNIHGIDFQTASTKGTSFEDIINKCALGEAIRNADYIIAHNAYFDVMILLNELHRAGMVELIDKINHIDTYNKIICTGEIGKRILRTGIRYPRLSELYEYYYFMQPPNAHNAGSDVKILLDVIPYLVGYKNKYIEDFLRLQICHQQIKKIDVNHLLSKLEALEKIGGAMVSP